MRLLVALMLSMTLSMWSSRGAAAHAEPPKLTLEQVIAKALASPKAEMAEGDRAAAEARVDEADAARMPRAKATAFGTISPEIRCNEATCVTTEPKNFALKFSGLFGSAQLDITQPLFTFGKIAHARTAARAGLDAQRALADEARSEEHTSELQSRGLIPYALFC